MGFWWELLIGLAVMILLVVLIGPGLWSSRISLTQSDDAPKDKDSKPDKQA